MTEAELEMVKRIGHEALDKAGERAIKALEDGTALGRKYGRIEGFIVGFAIGLLIASGVMALAHVR